MIPIAEFLTDAELNMLRRDAERTLQDTASVWRQKPDSVDEAGNVIQGDFEHIGDWPCFYRTSEHYQAGQETLFDRNALITRWRIDLPLTAPVRPDDRITINGADYRVLTILSGGTRAVLTRVEAELWQ